jgi:hypothetical protein
MVFTKKKHGILTGKTHGYKYLINTEAFVARSRLSGQADTSSWEHKTYTLTKFNRYDYSYLTTKDRYNLQRRSKSFL